MAQGDTFGAPPVKKSKRGLLIGLIAGAVVLLLVGASVAVLLTMKSKTDTESFAVGSCVKQSGSKATKAGCSDSGAFKVTQKVDSQDKCSDANQPFVMLERDGKKEILCLTPANP